MGRIWHQPRKGSEAAVKSEISVSLADIEAATDRLTAAIAALTDAQAAGPSLLPRWTRGHVLTHLARNADGMANVLRWARTGTQTPMYASPASRDADIEAGAGRPAGVLAADVRESAAVFAREASLVPDGAWTVLVRRTPGGEQFPAGAVLLRRLGEVEIHHADLGLGYGYRDWPEEFVAAYLPRVASSWAGRLDAPACLISPAGTDDRLPVGPVPTAGPPPACPVIRGPAADLLAWLLGRARGGALSAGPGGAPLPVLPPWR